MESLRYELETGFANLRGTQISGALPVAENLINATLAQSRNKHLAGLQVQIHASNQIVVHYRSWHLTAFLADSIDFETWPKLNLRLASRILAFTLGQVVNVPFAKFNGTQVTVDLGSIPMVAQYRALWKHIKLVNLSTSPGILYIRFRIAID